MPEKRLRTRRLPTFSNAVRIANFNRLRLAASRFAAELERKSATS